MLPQEGMVFKVSLVGALVGLLVLFVLAERMEVDVVNIGDIGKERVGEHVRVQGTVARVTDTPAVALAQVKDATGDITVVLFKGETVDVRKGMRVQVQGVVKEFRKRVEVEAKEVVVRGGE